MNASKMVIMVVQLTFYFLYVYIYYLMMNEKKIKIEQLSKTYHFDQKNDYQ